VLIGNTFEAITTGARAWLAPQALARLRETPAPVRAGAAERAVEAIAGLLDGPQRPGAV